MRFTRTVTWVLLAFAAVASLHQSLLIADDDATDAPRFTVEGESLDTGLHVRSVELIVDGSTPILPADWSVNLEQLDLSSEKSSALARWMERPECAFPKLRTVIIQARQINNDDQIATAIAQFLQRHPLVQKLVIHGDVAGVDDKSPKSSFLRKIDGAALVHLNRLTLHNCRVDGALPELLNACKLENLEIDFSGLPQSWPLTTFAFNQSDLQAIRRQNDLQSLTLVGCIAKTSDLDFLSQRDNPLAIRLIFCDVDSLIPFRHCESINLEGCVFENTTLSVLADFDRLRSFRSIRCGYKRGGEAVGTIRLPSSLTHFSLNTSDLSSPSDQQLIAAASLHPDCGVNLDIDNLEPDRVANLRRVQQLTFRCGIPSRDSLDGFTLYRT